MFKKIKKLIILWSFTLLVGVIFSITATAYSGGGVTYMTEGGGGSGGSKCTLICNTRKQGNCIITGCTDSCGGPGSYTEDCKTTPPYNGGGIIPPGSTGGGDGPPPNGCSSNSDCESGCVCSTIGCYCTPNPGGGSLPPGGTQLPPDGFPPVPRPPVPRPGETGGGWIPTCKLPKRPCPSNYSCKNNQCVLDSECRKDSDCPNGKCVISAGKSEGTCATCNQCFKDEKYISGYVCRKSSSTVAASLYNDGDSCVEKKTATENNRACYYCHRRTIYR